MKWIKFADELDSNMKNAKNIFRQFHLFIMGVKKLRQKDLVKISAQC